MLIEHPEDEIHEGLLRKVIDLLKSHSDESQVILSSHSSAVFNSVDPTEVRLVTMDSGKTRARGLTPQEVAVAKKYLEEQGTFADFLETVEEG